MLGWLRSLFSLLILVGLGALAWWGHHHEWGFAAHGPSESAAPAEAELLPGGRLRFTSPEAAELARLEFVSAHVSTHAETLVAPAVLAHDATREARLSSTASGVVWRLPARVGATVQAGDVLAWLDAPDVGRARADLAEAVLQVGVRTRTIDGLRQAGSVIPESRRREVESALNEARVRWAATRQRLAGFGLTVPDSLPTESSADELLRRVRFLGIPPELAAGLEREKTTCLLPVLAPFAGEVLACDVVTGEAVEAGRQLVTLADPRRLWLRVAVKPEDADRVRVGQTVRFQSVTASVQWVGPSADEATRTVEVRATLENLGQKEKFPVGLRGPARIVLRQATDSVLVPGEALLRRGEEVFVLVRDRKYRTSDEKILHLRRIQVGTQEGGLAEVLGGLKEGEVVATAGASRLFDLAQLGAPGVAGVP